MHPFGHLKTIVKHRHEVIRLCRKCGILLQGLKHDLSKFSPTEFIPGAKYYTGTRSPNEAERSELGYSSAWLHHKGRNRHHFEYWTDYNPAERRVMPVKMPKKYVAEMFCDRVAASRIYMGSGYNDGYPLEYFMRGKANRLIHPETSGQLEALLVMLRDEGEDATAGFIRNWLKGGPAPYTEEENDD